MSDWTERISVDTDRFINELANHGFAFSAGQRDLSRYQATLASSGRSIEIALKHNFPYTPPCVWLTDLDTTASWHANPDGSLCIYPTDEFGRQAWMDVPAFLSRIEEWRKRNDEDWIDDDPQLDADRYLNLATDDRLVIYGEEITHPGSYFELQQADKVLRSRPDSWSTSIRKRSKNQKPRFLTGLVTSVGELERPLRTWDDILALSTDSEIVQRSWSRGELDVLLVGYKRLGYDGVFAITAPRLVTGGKRQMRKASAVPATAKALVLRAGATDIRDKNVCLVGAGAIGSFIADLLVRAGVASLTLWDGDALLPGNAVRHLLTDPKRFGHSKVTALGQYFAEQPYSRTEVECVERDLSAPSDVVEVLDTYDLVVDATADSQATRMLMDAAELMGKHFVSVCTQNEGTTIRVDVIPPFDDEKPIPPTTLLPRAGDPVFESGCGDPLSMTPPHAVVEAAAIATRHIIGILIAAPEGAAGESREVGKSSV